MASSFFGWCCFAPLFFWVVSRSFSSFGEWCISLAPFGPVLFSWEPAPPQRRWRKAARPKGGGGQADPPERRRRDHHSTEPNFTSVHLANVNFFSIMFFCERPPHPKEAEESSTIRRRGRKAPLPHIGWCCFFPLSFWVVLLGLLLLWVLLLFPLGPLG